MISISDSIPIHTPTEVHMSIYSNCGWPIITSPAEVYRTPFTTIRAVFIEDQFYHKMTKEQKSVT